jgi:hypothetical protein
VPVVLDPWWRPSRRRARGSTSSRSRPRTTRKRHVAVAEQKRLAAYTRPGGARMIRRAGQTTESRSRIQCRCLPPSPLPPSVTIRSAVSGRERASYGTKDPLRNCLYVGNLGSSDHRDLEDLLSRFGVVRYAALVAGEAAAGAGHFGVVEMQSEDDACSAIRALSGFEIRGALLIVRWATPPEQTACGHPAMFGSMNLSNDVDGDEASPTPEPPMTRGGNVGAAINNSTTDSANPFPCEDLWQERATTSRSSSVEVRSRKDGG